MTFHPFSLCMPLSPVAPSYCSSSLSFPPHARVHSLKRRHEENTCPSIKGQGRIAGA